MGDYYVGDEVDVGNDILNSRRCKPHEKFNKQVGRCVPYNAQVRDGVVYSYAGGGGGGGGGGGNGGGGGGGNGGGGEAPAPAPEPTADPGRVDPALRGVAKARTKARMKEK